MDSQMEMNQPEQPNRPARWKGLAVSLIGNGHVRREMPCQDASAAIMEPRPALIVCDGRGSARLSQEGSRTAVQAFCSQINILDPYIADFLDRAETDEDEWRELCKIFYRTLVQAKLDRAKDLNLPETEFDFTAAFAIMGTRHAGFFQVGDGAIVIRTAEGCKTVFKPTKGEFANLTEFVRSGGDEHDNFKSALLDAEGITGIAATSDGPQHLMFNLVDMTPGPVFDAFLDRLADDDLTRNDILDYLSRPKWAQDVRGDDDRTIVIMCPERKIACPKKDVGQPENAPLEHLSSTATERSNSTNKTKEIQ